MPSEDIVPRTMSYCQRRILRAGLVAVIGAGLVGTAGAARADFIDDLKLEVGAMGGFHISAKNLELGVADDPTLPSPKNSGLVGLRLGLVLHPLFTLEAEGLL